MLQPEKPLIMIYIGTLIIVIVYSNNIRMFIDKRTWVDLVSDARFLCYIIAVLLENFKSNISHWIYIM